MFNRRIIIFLTVFVLLIGLLWWNWSNPAGISLQVNHNVISSSRYTQTLNGTWDRFSSLRQAWTTESERVQGQNNQSLLTGGRPLTMPSSEMFSIGAKRFRVPSEWTSRTMLLTLKGVQGHAAIYLNGNSSPEKIGEFEGSGGTDIVEIPPKAFRYGADNILIVALSASSQQRTMIFGSAWPESGRITGDVSLEAVVETTLTEPQLGVTWNGTTAQITIKTDLWHHGFTSDGPWTVYGVLSDGSAGVAEQTITVQSQNNGDHQPVSLSFTVPDARRWTPQSPFLYQLHLTVTNNMGDIDDLAIPIGLRTIAFSSGKWVLNDQVLAIKGEALTPDEEYKIRHAGPLDSWLKGEQSKGINLIYFIGQYPDDLWLEAADRTGMGIWAELPVAGVPSGRLPKLGDVLKDPSQKMIHPSLWAWTVSKGLDSDSAAQAFSRQAAAEVQPDLAFAIKTKPSSMTGLPDGQSLAIQGDKIGGAWGEVEAKAASLTKPSWQKESLISGFWALLMIFLTWMNIRSVTWRYKEIGTARPRRRLRTAWLWNGLLVLAREGLIGGLITSLLYYIPTNFSPWFVHLWPGVELLQVQSPWLIWGVLSMLGMLLRLLQVGIASPRMPNAPHVLGVLFWLERRYYFAVIVAFAWAALPWGIPAYIPLLAYFVFSCFLFPLRVHDIHRVGGHYLPFILVPGIIVGFILIWGAVHFADGIYLWHLLQNLNLLSMLKSLF
ncbi:beta-galactosidase/beta-glucuronidase [Desulfosporosinus acidiphilus SJ4]|uniref:Beta-galactosidase/beta-glucuronidase n=1 Tax=Desulfosporosinus acidiphilus (strain DSM 22704 / JCM 16185 / SJ4) TaxID=646529 RepID=I4DA28_DESAJ|nr:glycosyl hydrolase [Desulfosporosinus acidiphilus]AFM42652.1 beta-galactosidase/beta-glucuronidase [Desulfosporosinus acidiphilus SJ4]